MFAVYLERHSAVAPQIRPEVITTSCERAGAEKGLLTLPCAKLKHLETWIKRVCPGNHALLGAAAGSSTQHQELATFLSKAQAASHVMDRTLSMLSSCTPQPPQAVSILTSTGGPAMQYAPDPCTFALPPVQTRAVMTEAQAQQDLAWQSTLTEQVRDKRLLTCLYMLCLIICGILDNQVACTFTDWHTSLCAKQSLIFTQTSVWFQQRIHMQ